MKIVVAPDSYKGSLAVVEVASVMRDAILAVDERIEVVVKPMADGGEGTLDSLIDATGSEKVAALCSGATGRQQTSHFGITPEQTALIEMANIAGLEQVAAAERHPGQTTTIGVGEVMLAAYERGCRSFIVGLGGSATNDGGLGLLQALGMRAFDAQGRELQGFGRDLLKVARVCFEHFLPFADEVQIRIASDVDNPLCGSCGATYVYGPQKGLKQQELAAYDAAMGRFADLVEAEVQVRYQDVAGAGAAGGLGFALLVLGAQLVSGAELVAGLIGLDEALESATAVFTGEGQSDAQTLYGKAPSHVAELAAGHGVPAILISGAVVPERGRLLEKFAGCFSIAPGPISLEECMQDVRKLLFEQTRQITTLLTRIKM